jgi:hypothetical protein
MSKLSDRSLPLQLPTFYADGRLVRDGSTMEFLSVNSLLNCPNNPSSSESTDGLADIYNSLETHERRIVFISHSTSQLPSVAIYSDGGVYSVHSYGLVPIDVQGLVEKYWYCCGRLVVSTSTSSWIIIKGVAKRLKKRVENVYRITNKHEVICCGPSDPQFICGGYRCEHCTSQAEIGCIPRGPSESQFVCGGENRCKEKCYKTGIRCVPNRDCSCKKRGYCSFGLDLGAIPYISSNKPWYKSRSIDRSMARLYTADNPESLPVLYLMDHKQGRYTPRLSYTGGRVVARYGFMFIDSHGILYEFNKSAPVAIREGVFN